MLLYEAEQKVRIFPMPVPSYRDVWSYVDGIETFEFEWIWSLV